jgi:hypothetical protein
MREVIRSPNRALIWEIWAGNRGWVVLVIGIILFGWLWKWMSPGSFHVEDGQSAFAAIHSLLAIMLLLLVFGIFNYTEFNPQKGSAGFPHRLFTLPVTSLRLVTVPILLGVASIELVYFAAVALGRTELSGLTAVRLGVFMVLYQTILWTLAAFGALRTIVLGLVAIGFIFMGLPSLLPSDASRFARLAALAVIAFLFAWMYVALQRSGGVRYNGFKALIARIGDGQPSRRKGFSSPAAAQFWFEWRRSGLYLPLYIGGLLLVVIGPLSWYMRDEPGTTMRILAATLAMPIILALPVGKGFSKPDFWSADLSLPGFVAVRPLATAEMVVIKMQVAVLSTAISWSLVLVFLSLWLPIWANLNSLTLVQSAVSQIYGQFAQYAIVALSILAGVFLTWRFLVSGFWIGLSGNRKLFAASALPYGLSPIGLILVALLVRPDSPLRVWIRHDPDRLLSLVEWIALLALIAKFSLAAFSWRRIPAQRVRQYLPIWSGATLCLIALAILLWSGLRQVVPLDVYRLRNVLILGALLIIPFARLGLAPSFLAKNRHR